MENFQLVLAGTPCLQKFRVTHGRRDNFCPCKQFVSASRDNFSFPDSHAIKQITACFRSHNLALRAILFIYLFIYLASPTRTGSIGGGGGGPDTVPARASVSRIAVR